MKILVTVLSVMFVAGCEVPPAEVQVDGKDSHSYSKVCIEGVTYLDGYKRVTVMLDKNSQVIPCGEEKEIEYL